MYQAKDYDEREDLGRADDCSAGAGIPANGRWSLAAGLGPSPRSRAKVAESPFDYPTTPFPASPIQASKGQHQIFPLSTIPVLTRKILPV